ncbi:winged helix-turn-helix transcriptional regulator [Streptomyces sp. NPDC090080]|uniref:winged helix-turn-helix transcriptional regulator n=1 Tax=Streptomyces sp. NPDC090080 TaxID=3365939 RepID=UPI003819906B
MDLLRSLWFHCNVLRSTYENQDCSLARALEIIGERWTLLIMRDAFYGVRRFNDFFAHLDAPRSVLSGRLTALVGAGLLVRRPDPDHGGRHLYEVTDKGKTLWPALYALRTWGEQQAADDREPRRVFKHACCGEPLDPTARCGRCEVVPDPTDVAVHPVGVPGEGARTDPVAMGLRKPHRLLTPLPETDVAPETEPAFA